MLLALAVALAALAGCRAEGSAKREVVVFAASSLGDALRELEAQFEAAHPGVDVVLSFAGSQSLRLQIESGAPADVFASANPEHMRALESAALTEPSRTLAWNELVVVVPAENPAKIEQLRDLPRAERLVIGTRDVPAGAYARRMLERADAAIGDGFSARVLERVVSEELNVRMVLAKVSLGEADAGIVYRTDAISAGNKVRVVPTPAAVAVVAEYRVAVARAAGDKALARAFVDLLGSEVGQRALGRSGFQRVPSSVTVTSSGPGQRALGRSGFQPAPSSVTVTSSGPGQRALVRSGFQPVPSSGTVTSLEVGQRALVRSGLQPAVAR